MSRRRKRDGGEERGESRDGEVGMEKGKRGGIGSGIGKRKGNLDIYFRLGGVKELMVVDEF